MRPLFIAYCAVVENKTHHGWLVADASDVKTGADVKALADAVEDHMKFPRGVVIITNFRRLED
jgi:uncharacterized OB-fold protein